MSLYKEFDRRNVIRVAFAYVVVAWLIIQVAETIFPLFGFDNTPARIVVIALAVGFIPALVIAWTFELTPAGLKRESEIDPADSLTGTTGKTLDKVIMLVLALALGFFTFDKFVLDPLRDAKLVEETRQELRSNTVAAAYGDYSIAVLPFADMSQAGDKQYLSDGLAEELLNLLVQVDGLRVASRTSSFNLRDQNLSISEMAQRLNVAHILEGSIRLFGDQLRVTVQLIEAGSDTHLWSKNYDRKFDNIFAIQDDIAISVVEELKGNLVGPESLAEKPDPKAYQLYLQARFLMRRADPDESQMVIDILEQAVAIDPNFYGPWHLLADMYQRQAIWEVAELNEVLPKSREAARRAAEIQPDSARIHILMGWIAMRWDEDFEQAAIHYQRAVDLTEDPVAKVSIANELLRHVGRHEFAVELGEYYVQKFPTHADNHKSLARAYLRERRYPEAIQSMRTALTLSSGIDEGNGILSYAFLLNGQYDEALETAALEKLPFHRMPVIVMALDELGQSEEADAAFEEMVADESVDASWQAEIYLRRGDKNMAFAVLEGLSAQNGEITWETFEKPTLQPLHDDPRWQALVDRTSPISAKPTHIKLDVPVPEQWQ